MDLPNILIQDYTYDLPQERIAKYPLEYRDMSKLLVYNLGEITETEFFRLPAVVPDGMALVYNNSRVIAARLLFKKETGASIEIFCLEPVEPPSYEQNLDAVGMVEWKCLVGNKKRWKEGGLVLNIQVKGQDIVLKASFSDRGQTEHLITFSWDHKNISFGEILEAAGSVPIPPYLMREAEEIDKSRYQTIYSSIKGSVAAPTAGLHFTPRIFEQLEYKGCSFIGMTLHVGAGTFIPVQSQKVSGHKMHEETFIVSLDQLLFLKNNIGNILAIGTTSMRLLESIYHMGVKCLNNDWDGMLKIGQWAPYENNQDVPPLTSITALIRHFKNNNLEQVSVRTSIIIVPGYKFRMVNALVTNFHQPGSTLLLLVAAFIGNDWKRVYQYALDNGFRFLSYGDGSVLFPKVGP
jgi:S-adenosylmethionine:tRNA ribosyltransferase-isomerase